jgi:hypothetical protein
MKEKQTIWEKILKPEVGEKIYNKIMGIGADEDKVKDKDSESQNDPDKSDKKDDAKAE